MKTSFSCPSCGYNFKKPSNISSKILQMVSSWSRETTLVLKDVMRKIYDNVPSDKNKEAYYYFLLGIQKYEEQHIRHGIRVFTNGNHHMQGKGFSFLKAIIDKRSANFTKQLENERRLHGKPPKKRILK